ncbi:Putative FKBP-type peptidyl-prolyl cis-trans isomerase [uncultured archaeon]|nr:Putative FKBP-type peptidyl-prolyl cis-trans isomerase [uncultured archaeon]
MAVKTGDFIRLSFTGKLEDGTLFDTTEAQVAKDAKVFDERINYKPVLLVVGRQQAIRGLDEAVIGMAVGQEKDINLPPEKAFGQKNPDLITVVPASHFDKEKVSPVPGMIVNINNQDGMVKSVGAGRVIVDFNHPLAGRDLTYHIKLVEVLETPMQKVKALFDDTGMTGTASLDKDTVLVSAKADPTETYIFKKQTFLAWMREIPDVKKIRFTEEYELTSTKPAGGHDHDHDHAGHDHSHAAPAPAEKKAEAKPKASKPKKQ